MNRAPWWLPWMAGGFVAVALWPDLPAIFMSGMLDVLQNAGDSIRDEAQRRVTTTTVAP